MWTIIVMNQDDFLTEQHSFLRPYRIPQMHFKVSKKCPGQNFAFL